MKSNFLFTYGLLRKKANHKMSHFLSERADFISEAYFQGKLYLIDYYPGITSSGDPSDKVIGDLFKLHDTSILKELDHFEGVGSEYDLPNEYRREIVPVTLYKGIKKEAWVYMYNWKVNLERQIHSGDFLNDKH